MPVIKPPFVTTPATAYLPVDLDAEARVRLEAAAHEAARIVADARERAGAILAEAEHAAQAARDRGYEQGLADGVLRGRADGRLAALADAQKALAPGAARVEILLAELAASLDDARRRAWTGAQSGVVKLALAVARALVQREIASDPSLAAPAIARAIEVAESARGLEIRVHPDDLLLVDQFVPDLAPRLVADAEVPRGEGRSIAGDASLDSQLEAVRRALLGDAA
jgi:flagellar assembly protein FliH